MSSAATRGGARVPGLALSLAVLAIACASSEGAGSTEIGGAAGTQPSASAGTTSSGGARTSSGGTTSASSGGASAAGNRGGATGSGGTSSGAGAGGWVTSSWMGFQAPDQVTLGSDQFVPVVASDCPDDPAMNGAAVIFQNSATGMSDALLFDWTHAYGGWHAATIAPPGWAALDAPTTDSNAKLVYWIKGDQGGEQSAFFLGIGFKDNVNSGELWPPGVPAVTTEWHRVAIPLSSFAPVTDTSGVASLRTGNSHSAQHARYLIDNVYITTGP